MKRIGHVEIHDHIDAVFLGKLTLQNPELFNHGNTPENLKWLSKQVKVEEKRREREPWKLAGTFKVDLVKGRTLIRSIQLFFMKGESLLSFAATKDEQKVLLTVVIQLPEDMQYLHGQIQCGRISTFDPVQRAVNKKVEAHGKPKTTSFALAGN